MVTHGNLVANCWAIATQGLQLQPGDRALSWLPLYHDMGLIGMVLTPIVKCVEIIFIPTLTFVKRPNTWLAMMHRYRAHYSFGPNFAYALAARRASDEDVATWTSPRSSAWGAGRSRSTRRPCASSPNGSRRAGCARARSCPPTGWRKRRSR